MRHHNYVDSSAIVARRFPGLHFSRQPNAAQQFAEDWEIAYRLGQHYRMGWTGRTTVDYRLSAGLLRLLDEQRRESEEAEAGF